MFTKKTKSENTKSKDTNTPENQTTLKSWLTGKLGSFILFTAVGYGLYKFGIISKITNYFKQDKGKTPATK